jgi:hypothetical protein
VHGAAFRGWTELVKVLAAEGADLLAADNNGHTPVDAAMGRMRGAGGRAASVINVYEDTAAAIEELVAGAASPVGAASGRE